MQKNNLKFVFFLLTLVLMPCEIFSQRVVLIRPGDTLIGYTPKQNNWLLVQLDRLDEVLSLDSICEAQRLEYKSAIQHADTAELNLTLKQRNYEEIDSLYQYQVKKAMESQKEAAKAIKRQKLYKYLVLVGGAVTSSFMAYQWLRK